MLNRSNLFDFVARLHNAVQQRIQRIPTTTVNPPALKDIQDDPDAFLRELFATKQNDDLSIEEMRYTLEAQTGHSLGYITPCELADLLSLQRQYDVTWGDEVLLLISLRRFYDWEKHQLVWFLWQCQRYGKRGDEQ